MMCTLIHVENKGRGLFLCSGALIFEACDTLVQGLLIQADRAGKIYLTRQEDYQCHTKLVKGIIWIIAQDTPTESEGSLQAHGHPGVF